MSRLSLLLSAIFAFAVGGGCDGDVPENQWYVHNTMNLRAGPDTSYDVVAQVHRGDTLRLMAETPAGWSQLEGSSAFIYSAHRYIRAEAALPVPDFSEYGPCADEMADTFRHYNSPPKSASEDTTAQGQRTVSWGFTLLRTYQRIYIQFEWGPGVSGCNSSIILQARPDPADSRRGERFI